MSQFQIVVKPDRGGLLTGKAINNVHVIRNDLKMNGTGRKSVIQVAGRVPLSLQNE